jgi:hypothetical protein
VLAACTLQVPLLGLLEDSPAQAGQAGEGEANGIPLLQAAMAAGAGLNLPAAGYQQDEELSNQLECAAVGQPAGWPAAGRWRLASVWLLPAN